MKQCSRHAGFAVSGAEPLCRFTSRHYFASYFPRSVSPALLYLFQCIGPRRQEQVVTDESRAKTLVLRAWECSSFLLTEIQRLGKQCFCWKFTAFISFVKRRERGIQANQLLSQLNLINYGYGQWHTHTHSKLAPNKADWRVLCALKNTAKNTADSQHAHTTRVLVTRLFLVRCRRTVFLHILGKRHYVQ